MTYPSPGGWARPQPPRPAPLDQPQYDATAGQAVSRFWRKYAVFSGRASRSEYWWWTLVSFGVSVVLQVIGRLALGPGLGSRPPVGGLDLAAMLLPLTPALLWALAVLVPSTALAVRRLHDTNRSGWWYLLMLPTAIGLPLQLVGLASIDPARLAVGDLAGLAIGPLLGGWVLSLLGLIGSVILLVFFVKMPDPRGVRFDAARAW